MTPVFFMGSAQCELAHRHDERCTYRIAWSINPHMNPGLKSDTVALASRARAQHAALKEALRDAGAEVFVLPFVQGAFDSVFVKDAAFLLSTSLCSLALLSNPLHPERRMEIAQRERELRRAGFAVATLESLPIEGGDLVKDPAGDRVFVGYGPRSQPGCWRELQEECSVRSGHSVDIVPLELRDPYLYHLDTALASLDGGWVLACREAFEPKSWSRLRTQVGAHRLLEIPRDEAVGFAANIIEIGDRVITGSPAPRTLQLLREIGKTPVYVPLDSFHLAGGSAACLVSRVQLLGAKPVQLRRSTIPTAAIRSAREYASVSISSPKMSGSSSA